MKTITLETTDTIQVPKILDVELPCYRQTSEYSHVTIHRIEQVEEDPTGETFRELKVIVWEGSPSVHIGNYSITRSAFAELYHKKSTPATKEEFTRALQNSLYTIDSILKEEYV